LASKPGKIFSREELLDAINVDPNGPYDRSVDGHISKIRNKLKAVNAEHEPIVTHWALGYSLREEWS
jgi:two-component system catabolic regulation response regulator CreB